MEIKIIRNTITQEALEQLAQGNYGNMVKGVVDVRSRVIALGGELHADAEAILLQNGSEQKDLWGFNIYTDKPYAQRLGYISLINIRPSQNNLTLEIQSAPLKKQIREIIDALVGGRIG